MWIVETRSDNGGEVVQKDLRVSKILKAMVDFLYFSLKKLWDARANFS